MNCLLFNNTSCSLKQTSTIVLFYKRLKGLSFRSHNAKFWLESYLVANSRRQVFSWRGSFIYPVWHLFNHYPTKSGQKTHPYTFSLLKNFQYHQNNKSITCTCMYAAKDLKYMPNLCLMYTAAVLCPWARHFTPRKYWLITQEAMAPSRHDWKIVDWDVKPQHNQPTNVPVKVWNQYCFCILHSTKHYFMVKRRKAHHRLGTSFNMWAAAWQNQQNDLCAEGRRRSAWAFAQSDQSSLSAWRTMCF